MILYRRDMLPCAQSKAVIFTCQLHGTDNFIPVCFLRSRPAKSWNRNGEDGTAHVPHYSFRRAPAQSVEEIDMSLGCEHHQIRTPLTLSFYDFVYYIALSYQDIIGPAGQVRRFNYRCVFPMTDVNEPEFSHGAIKAPHQK